MFSGIDGKYLEIPPDRTCTWGTLSTDILFKMDRVRILHGNPSLLVFLSHWLNSFAYRANISLWIFVTAGLITLLITLMITSWKSWQATKKNPVESLKTE